MGAPCKCVIWDLDNTVWDGVCLEGDVRPRTEIRSVLAALQQRGIVHSVASRGERDVALRTLEQHNLSGFFLHPRINWLPKSTNILEITRELNIGLNAAAFVDDDAFEREQVAFMLPEVRVIAAEDAEGLPGQEDFSPSAVTAEATARSRLYAEEGQRREAEASFGSREEFLLSCQMELSVRPMTEAELPRVLELMTRTHQLNTTGIFLDSTELQRLLTDPASGSSVRVAELRDRFGWCGIVGIALIEEQAASWMLKLFALSCRVMGRGIERAFLAVLVEEAVARGRSVIRSQFRETGHNRMMRAMYQMTGFRPEYGTKDGTLVFALDRTYQSAVPQWVHVS